MYVNNFTFFIKISTLCERLFNVVFIQPKCWLLTQLSVEINRGLVIYLGVGKEDDDEDLKWMAKKIVHMRIFSDENGKMNQSVLDIDGGLLVISQFTLFASTKKGNRPSFIKSAIPDKAKELYKLFINHFKEEYSIRVESGEFGAHMKVEYINDGPVTILLDSKNKE